MPVRALRPSRKLATYVGEAVSESINARKGIKTPNSHTKSNEKRGSESINARKGIKTESGTQGLFQP